MDTEAQHQERDRSFPPVTEDSPRPRDEEARSRFAVVRGAGRDGGDAVGDGAAGGADRLGAGDAGEGAGGAGPAGDAADGDGASGAGGAGPAGDAAADVGVGTGGADGASDEDDRGGADGSGGGFRDWLPGGSITLTVGACLVFLLALTLFVAQPFRIPSSSMEPALRSGDRVLVNKLAYRFGSGPARGDVVVFEGGERFGEGYFVKRVAGVGGDHVVCCDRDGRLRINGRAVDESDFLEGDAPSAVPFDVVVPAGRLFLLGDHRAASRDSRDHLGSPGGGMVPVEDVTGRADWILWPAGRWTRIEPSGAYAGVPEAEGAHG